MMPFDRYPGGGTMFLGKCGGGNCRHGYCLTLQQLTGQTSCAYCGLSLVDTYEHWLLMSVDHVIPTQTGLALGIERSWVEDFCNTVLSCSGCNGFRNRFPLPATAAIPTGIKDFVELRDAIFLTRKELILTAHE